MAGERAANTAASKATDTQPTSAEAGQQTKSAQSDCGCGSKKAAADTSDESSAASRSLVLIVSAGLPNTIEAGGPYALREGESLTLGGVVSEPSEGLTYSWDVNGDGIFGDATGLNPELSWAQLTALGIENGPSSFNVRLRVDDGDGGIMTSLPVRLTVMNANPKANISGPADVAVGQSANFVLTATDASPGDQAANFTYRIDWNGDGVVDQVINGSASINVPHTFAEPGPARAGDGHRSRQRNQFHGHLTRGRCRTLLLPNAENPALTDLVGGTSGADEVTFVQLGATTIRVTETRLNGSVVNNVQTYNNITGRVIARGAAGHDLLDATALTATKATLDGGAGNDTLYGGQAGDLLIGGSNGGEGQQGHNTIVAGHGDNTIYGNAIVGAEGSTGGNNLIIGGAGDDTIYGNFGTVQRQNGNPSDGGEGGQNLIVGGSGNDVIYASQQADGAEGGHGSILIAGGTNLNEAALSSVLSEWTSNRDYATRIANISGIGLGPRNNGDHFLQAGVTVPSDAAIDALYSDSQGGANWLLYTFAQDEAQRVKAGEVETDVPPSQSAPGTFLITGPESPTLNDDILITWQASEGATSYEVVLSANSDLSSPFFTQVVVGTELAINDLGPRLLYIGVVASNEHGATAASNNRRPLWIAMPDLRQTLFVTDLVYAPVDFDFIPPQRSSLRARRPIIIAPIKRTWQAC